MKKLLLATLGVAVLAGGLAWGQTTISIAQVLGINSDDLFQDVVHGYPTAQSKYASATLLGNFPATQPGNNNDNQLIGGDATTNLFVHGTTGSSVTTAVTYGGPNNWAYWSGASTAMTVSQDTTAADLPLAFGDAFKMARTSGQTGVVQVCMMQEVETVNSYQFAGQTAELDFHAATGANFSGASANMTAYIITGTGTDEGIAGTTSAAFNLNAGGGGSGSWTGQVNWAATVPLGSVSNLGRYTVAAPIPAAATEIGVALCWTPVGTAGTNDYIAFSGIQLTRNSALTSLVKSNASGTATFVGANDLRAKTFSRRTQQLETSNQQRYAYAINEASITAGAIALGGGTALGTSTTCSINVTFPATMRIAPTYTNALTASTFKLVSASQAATALSTPFSATLVANSMNSASINFTTTGMTAKDGCELVSAAGVGKMLWTAEM